VCLNPETMCGGPTGSRLALARMPQPGEWTQDRLAAALSGPHPSLLRRMRAGVALLGNAEEPPGSCVLVVDDPSVRRLTDLPREHRVRFLEDVDLLGEAVHNVCRRHAPGFGWVDLEIRGGGDLLAASVRPRYLLEGGARGTHDDLRAELLAELDVIDAAGRADYPAQHVYGSRPTRRSV